MKQLLKKIFSKKEPDYLDYEQRIGIIDLFIYLDLKCPSKGKIDLSKIEPFFHWHNSTEPVSEYIDGSYDKLKKVINNFDQEAKFLKKTAKKIDSSELIEIVFKICKKVYANKKKALAKITKLISDLQYGCKLSQTRRKTTNNCLIFGIPFFIFLFFLIVNPVGTFWTIIFLGWGLSSLESPIGQLICFIPIVYIVIYFLGVFIGIMWYTSQREGGHNFFLK